MQRRAKLKHFRELQKVRNFFVFKILKLKELRFIEAYFNICVSLKLINRQIDQTHLILEVNIQYLLKTSAPYVNAGLVPLQNGLLNKF